MTTKQDNRQWIAHHHARPCKIQASWDRVNWHIAPVEEIPEPFTIIGLNDNVIIIDTSHLPDHPFTILWSYRARLLPADQVTVREEFQKIYHAELAAAEAERIKNETTKSNSY